MENAQVYQDTISRILDLCRQSFDGDIHGFYEGDPIEIPKSMLPCIIVEKLTGTISVTGAPTGFDRQVDSISVRVVYDKSDDLGATDDVDLTERKLRRFIEARDPDTNRFKAGTLMQLLRTHITVDETLFNSDVEINYDVNARPGEMATSEGQVLMTTYAYVEADQRN